MLKNKVGILGVAALLCAVLGADTVINGNRIILGTWDASQAASVRPVRMGTSLPGTCVTGEVYLKTNAAANRMLFVCSASNTWTQAAYAHGVLADTPTTCDAGEIYFATDAAAGRNLYFCNPANAWNQMASGVASLSSANTFSGANTFTGLLDASRATQTLPAQTGAALPPTCTPGALFFKTDAPANRMLYACSAANTWSQAAYSSGPAATRPAACDSGQIYFATDTAAGQNLYFCNPANTWNQMSGGGSSLPPQSGNAGALLTTNGTTASWRSWDWGDQAGGWTSTFRLANGTGTNGNVAALNNWCVWTMMLRFPRMTFNRALFSVGTSCTSCAFRMALYAPDMTTRVWDSGALTDAGNPGIGSTGVKILSFPNITVDEGWYWFVWSANSTTLKYYGLETTYGFPNLMNTATVLSMPFAGRVSNGPTGAGNAFDLPASLGSIWPSDGQTNAPYVFFVRQ